MFYEFNSSVPWIICVIQASYLYLAAMQVSCLGTQSITLLCCSHQATFLSITASDGLFGSTTVAMPSLAFETDNTKGCWCNELMLLAKSRDRMDHLEVAWTALACITHNDDGFWVNFRLIFSAFVVWGLARDLRLCVSVSCWFFVCQPAWVTLTTIFRQQAASQEINQDKWKGHATIMDNACWMIPSSQLSCVGVHPWGQG